MPICSRNARAWAEEASAAVLFTTIIAAIAFPATAWLLDVPVP
ncbi:MAG: hypothetical protein ACKPAC_13740 [Alphaproteobacteria bacterium]